MVQTRLKITGNISTRKKISGKLNSTIIKMYPELEDIVITPAIEEQDFISEKYGYKNIKVKGIEAEELNVTPNAEEQEFTGTFNKVIVGIGTNSASATATANDILIGRTAFVNNEEVVGTVPEPLDLSQIKEAYRLYAYNTNMTERQDIELSNATTIASMNEGCSKMETAGSVNAPNATTAASLYRNCSVVTSIGDIIISKATRLDYALAYCYALEVAPNIDAPNCENYSYICSSSSKLREVPLWYMGKATNISSMFGSSNLEILGGFKDLGKAYTAKTNNAPAFKLVLSAATNLTHESLMNVINNLYDLNLSYNVEGGGTLYNQTLNIGETNIAKLTEEELAIGTEKRMEYYVKKEGELLCN